MPAALVRCLGPELEAWYCCSLSFREFLENEGPPIKKFSHANGRDVHTYPMSLAPRHKRVCSILKILAVIIVVPSLVSLSQNRRNQRIPDRRNDLLLACGVCSPRTWKLHDAGSVMLMSLFVFEARGVLLSAGKKLTSQRGVHFLTVHSTCNVRTSTFVCTYSFSSSQTLSVCRVSCFYLNISQN